MIIIEDSKLAESKPSKKLWSFIKKQKSENIGVSPLKVNRKWGEILSGSIALVGFRFFNNFDVPSGVIMMSCI
jgi:hypothetical protein